MPPLSIIGPCILLLVFPPEDRVLRALFRVVQGLVYGLILGAGSSHGHAAALDYIAGTEFRPGIASGSIPFRLSPEHTIAPSAPTGVPNPSISDSAYFDDGNLVPTPALQSPPRGELSARSNPPRNTPEFSMTNDLSWEGDDILEWPVVVAESVQLDGFC